MMNLAVNSVYKRHLPQTHAATTVDKFVRHFRSFLRNGIPFYILCCQFRSLILCLLRKPLAILLLLVHLFNFAGYALLFEFFISRADARHQRRIEAGAYNESRLKVLKVPLRLPYQTDWKEYERVDGTIEIAGVYYSYVKRKISQDTLYLVCLPNDAKTSLKKASNNYGQETNGIQGSTEKSDKSVKKPVLGSDYCEQSLLTATSSMSSIISKEFPRTIESCRTAILPAAFIPPDNGCLI
ncbi:hypothetical protein OI18_02095 [Flavihumibacter solisilvae]|uniref:Uncharacterized protein n=1 Tax=Flavihumibacter solisilvae TaxID=1349421 RepID=A0A0C1IZU0_9BACT|nr:hypothetical protein OI18_02095 [Flavihumibacter solisilvae]